MVLKVMSSKSGLGQLATGKLCQPWSKWVSLSNMEKKRQRNERGGLRLSDALIKTQ